MLNTKILLSLVSIGAVSATAVYATGAYFSDTETATANTIKAGTIDLQVKNTAYKNGVAIPPSTWNLTDLTLEKFFNFSDLKPNDWGEGTITIKTTTNPSYACASIVVTDNSDNGITEPEDEVDEVLNDDSDGTPEGDLGKELEIYMWPDDGDNVLEDNENPKSFAGGSFIPGVDQLDVFALSSPTAGIFGYTGLVPNTEYHIGTAWCYGKLLPTPLVPGNYSPTTDQGFTCDGAPVTNLSQTDKLEANISFYVVQTRNNDNFQCTKSLFPIFPTPTPSPTPEP